jgi:hypothetical protein
VTAAFLGGPEDEASTACAARFPILASLLAERAAEALSGASVVWPGTNETVLLGMPMRSVGLRWGDNEGPPLAIVGLCLKRDGNCTPALIPAIFGIDTNLCLQSDVCDFLHRRRCESMARGKSRWPGGHILERNITSERSALTRI